MWLFDNIISVFQGQKERTGAVDLISHCKLLPHHEASSQCCAFEIFSVL
jgi:hypothetical protein